MIDDGKAIDTAWLEFLEKQTSTLIITDDVIGNINIVPLEAVTSVHADHYVTDGYEVPFSHSVLWIGVGNRGGRILLDPRSQDALGRRAGEFSIVNVLEDGWATPRQIAKLGMGPVICTCAMDSKLCRFYFKTETDAIAAQALIASL